jgi:hypothetical protein
MRLQQGDSLKGAALAAATGYVWGVSVLLLATGVLKIVSPPHEAMLSPFAAASFGCVEVVLGLWVLHPRSIIPFQAAIALSSCAICVHIVVGGTARGGCTGDVLTLSPQWSVVLAACLGLLAAMALRTRIVSGNSAEANRA